MNRPSVSLALAWNNRKDFEPLHKLVADGQARVSNQSGMKNLHSESFVLEGHLVAAVPPPRPHANAAITAAASLKDD